MSDNILYKYVYIDSIYNLHIIIEYKNTILTYQNDL